MTERKAGGARDLLRTLVYALAIALLVRTLAFEPFNIPSGSMKPTLLVGDYLFVSKFSYGYSRFSLPFGLPLFSGRIFERMPKRGDIVVFKLPADNKTDYIKRVVGLPGDRLQMKDGVLYINGVQVHASSRTARSTTTREGRDVPEYRETLPDGRTHLTIDLTPNGAARQHARLRGAARPPLRDGRQPRQLAGQPVSSRCRLHAGREPDRPGRVHLLLHRRQRAPVLSLELAVGDPLRPASSVRSSRRAIPGAGPPRRAPPRLEAALGHAFADRTCSSEALTHASASGRHGRQRRTTSAWSSWATGCSA